MIETPSIDLRPLVAALWRRRFLLCLPVLIALPIAVVFALFAPKTYVAKSLLLLQEAGRDNPLAKDQSLRMNERAAGLQALAKSDLVLSGVLADIAPTMGGQAPTSPKEIADWKQDFINRVEIELVGTDFLSLSLKGSKPKGMGRQLEALTARLLEALLAERGATSATQFLIDRRKRALEAAEQAYAAQKIETLKQPGNADQKAKLEALRQQAHQLAESLAKASSEAERARQAVIANGGLPDRVEVEIDRLAKPAQDSHREKVSTAGATQGRLAALLQLRDAEASRMGLKERLVKVNQTIEAAERDTPTLATAEQTEKSLEKELSEAREAYQAHSSRYAGAARRSLGVLSAPERITVIDPPRDPETAVFSGAKYALAGLIASIGLAVALVLLAELMDQTVRSEQEFERITGAPVLVRLS